MTGTIPQPIASEVQRLSTDALVELYKLEYAVGEEPLRWTPSVHANSSVLQQIPNPCLEVNTQHWAVGGTFAPTLSAAKDVNPNFVLEGHGSGHAIYAGTILEGQWCRVRARTITNGTYFPVDGGAWYEFHALLAPSKCRAYVGIGWFNSAGTFLGQQNSDFVTNPGTVSNATQFSAYTRAWVLAQAPEGAAQALIFLDFTAGGAIGGSTTGASLIFSQCYFGRASADAVAPTPYMPFPLSGRIVFQAPGDPEPMEYTPYPIAAEGFEWRGKGPAPRPRIRVSNIDNVAGSFIVGYSDLVGAKITRIRTFARFLGGQPTTDYGAYIEPDIWYVERKVRHDPTMIEWELSSVMDQQGRRLPGRQCLRDVCTQIYRVWDAKTGQFDYTGVTCPYTSAAYYTEDGIPTGPEGDRCGKRLDDCRLRGQTAGWGALPTWAFPGLARTR